MCIDGWRAGWMNESLGGWLAGWMDGWGMDEVLDE
jgi:hypothetical protein